MTSHNFSVFLTPFCHAKMTILLTTLFRLLQKSEPTPPSCMTSFMNVPKGFKANKPLTIIANLCIFNT